MPGELIYYYKLQKSTRPFKFAAVFGEWPVRSLKSRGLKRIIHRRKATQEEVTEIRSSKRFLLYWYKDIEELLADGIMTLGRDSTEFKKLEAALNKS